MNIIVTNLKSVEQWLGKKGITGKVVKSLTPEDAAGQDIFGINAVPTQLASKARSVTCITMQNLTQDITPEEMDEAGARLETYVVMRVPLEFVSDFYDRVMCAESEPPHRPGTCKWCRKEDDRIVDECDDCWEIRTRAERRPEIAAKIVSTTLHNAEKSA